MPRCHDETQFSEPVLEPVASEDDDYDSSPPDYNIVTYPADYTLEVLFNMWRKDEIIVPPFQRDFVWKQTQSSRLIESFLAGLPVPAIFLYRDEATNTHLVIDGQQRLSSIFYYLNGYFGPETQGKRPVFRLKGLSPDSEFHEKTFCELSATAQRGLQNSVLRAFIVRQLDPDDATSIYHIFARLNTGGTMLRNQEVRNCVYHGQFSALLDRLNELPEWRRIFGRKAPDARRRDTELILRFLALQDTTAYKKPMKDFLSRFMKKNQNPADGVLRRIESVFTSTCTEIVSTLGERPFHVRSGLNAAVFDAVMRAFSRNLSRIPEDVRSRYLLLVGDDGFDACTRSHTTDVEVVLSRLDQAEQVLFR